MEEVKVEKDTEPPITEEADPLLQRLKQQPPTNHSQG
jgi:hypothetical protein